MTKADLITKVAESTGSTKADAEKSIDAVFSSITGALADGDKFTLVGFGSFEVTSRAAKTGRNPQTGAAIEIPASKAVKFKAGKGLKDAVK